MDEIRELLDMVPPPEPNLEFETNWPHRKYESVKYITDGYSTNQHRSPAKREDADLVSSQTVDGMHAPAIDIDMPCRLVPSGTEGHFHLYIDKVMDFKTYDKLLKALVEAGIVEKGFYDMARKNKASHLRVPGKPKGQKSIVKSPSGGGYW